MKSTFLVRYDAACRAIEMARSVDEAMTIGQGGEALRAYGRVAKNKELEVDGAEIRLRAERRVGELIIAQKQSVGLARPAVGSKVIGSKRVPIKDTRPTLAEAGIDKKLSARSQILAAIQRKQFEAMVAEWRDRVIQETERVTTNLLREGDRQQKSAARKAPPLPIGIYRLLYADPPWRYEHIVTESRAIENQYPTMSLDEIKALRIPAADDAVLFLWATSPKLAEAIDVIRAWDFDYRTSAVWDKGSIGMGYYFRQQHELLLVAARGNAPIPAQSSRVSSVIRAPRGVHSEKPTIVYELLESMYPTFTTLDRIELFCRSARDGWARWGNEQAVAV